MIGLQLVVHQAHRQGWCGFLQLLFPTHSHIHTHTLTRPPTSRILIPTTSPQSSIVVTALLDWSSQMCSFQSSTLT